MNKRDGLIFNLIFGEKNNFLIDLSEYVVDIYLYDQFVDEIREILRKSKVMIVNSVIKVDSKTAMWELKVKK